MMPPPIKDHGPAQTTRGPAIFRRSTRFEFSRANDEVVKRNCEDPEIAELPEVSDPAALSNLMAQGRRPGVEPSPPDDRQGWSSARSQLAISAGGTGRNRLTSTRA
jgi:hypothetical protein